MHRSLWLLLRLRFKGWGRRMLGGLGSVRGVLMVLLAGGFLGMMLLGAILQKHAGAETLEKTRSYGPLALIGMCVMQILFSGNERGLYFSPAEVQFLFTAPLTRRQLLAYKVLGNLGVTVLIALFLGIAFRSWSASVPAGMVGVFLLFSFMQLLAMVLNLAGCALGAHAFNRRRQIVLGILAIALLAAIIQATGNPLDVGWAAWARGVQDTQLGQVVLFPVRCFFEAFTAEQLWPDLVLWTGLSLVVLGFMLGLIFMLDAQYLEAAASASERIYARFEQLRRGGGMAAYSASGRLTLPCLPRWAGAGPLAWRQFMGLLRAWKSLLVYVVIFVPIILYSWFGGAPAESASATRLSALAVVLPFLSMLLYVGPSSLRCDFRADLDRMEVLKALPLSPWLVALGQLLAPAVLLSLLSWLILGYLIVKDETDYLLLIAALAVPACFLMIALENLLFLWYPTRLTTGAGDFRHFGRHMLLGISRLILFMIAIAPAAIAGTIVYFLFGSQLLAGAVAWLLAAGVCVGGLALVALAFQRFDVARDVP